MLNDRLTYNQKVATLVARLKERRRDFRVRVERRKLTTSLYIVAPGTRDTYKTFILPLIRDAFPEAHMTSGSFTPEPWASDPYMKVTISLDPKVPERNTMKTIYQACDGEIFECQAEAVDHENGLFDDWLEVLLSGHPEPTLSTVVRHFNDSHHLTRAGNDYHGTPWNILKESLKTYWEDAILSRLKHTKRSD